MATRTTVYQGANALLSRPTVQADGSTPLDPTSLVLCQVQLVQAGRVVRTLARDTDPELRNMGGATPGVELELTSAITAALKKGPLTERWYLAVASAGYTAEPGKSIKAVIVNQLVIA